jgi:hypothetical protein
MRHQTVIDVYLLLEVVVQDRNIPKYETPVYTPPLRRLVCLSRSSQISDIKLQNWLISYSVVKGYGDCDHLA